MDPVEVDLVEVDADVATVMVGVDPVEVDQVEVDDSCDYVCIPKLPEVCSPV